MAPKQNHPGVDLFLLLGGEPLKWDLHVCIVFYTRLIEDRIGKLQVCHVWKLNPVFNIWGTFSNRGKGLKNLPLVGEFIVACVGCVLGDKTSSEQQAPG